MKPGPQGELHPSQLAKKQKPNITKSWQTLLGEVFLGEFTDFRAYLIQENIIELDLSGSNIGGQQVKMLGQALKDTCVTTVDLANNQIGPDGANDFGQALKDTLVTTVDLTNNQIGDVGANDFVQTLKDTRVTMVYLNYNQISDVGALALATVIPETFLVTLSGHFFNFFNFPVLKTALQLNQPKVIFTPFYVTCLRFMPDKIKDKRYPSDVVMNMPHGDTEKELEYACGIIMNLLPELVEHVNSFLPDMSRKLKRKNGITRAANYTLLANEMRFNRPLLLL